MADSRALFQDGLALHQKGEIARAGAIYARILESDPRNFDALHMSGVIAIQSKDFGRAVTLIGQAIALSPDDPTYAAAYSNRAIAYKGLGRSEAALADLNRILEWGVGGADAYFNRGNTLFDLQRYDAAAADYACAVKLRPDDAELYNSLGITQNLLNRFESSAASFKNAIRTRPTFAAAYINLGVTLRALGEIDAALANYAKALDLAPRSTDAFNNRAGLLIELGRHSEALLDLKSLVQLNPLHPFAAGLKLHEKMYICDWQGVGAETATLVADVAQGRPVTPSWLFLTLSDSPPLQQKAAEIWTKARHPPNAALGPIAKYAKHEKIRLGYYSTDFYSHATAYVLAEFFELHDRTRFELTAFSFGPDIKDAMHQRLAAAFDRFIDVSKKPDHDIAALSRALEIDIAVDLKGYTTGYRAGIFAHRAAPLQVNYMGTAATLGSEVMDYIIADKTVIPPADFAYFTEQVVHLPHSYYVNDRKRPLSEKNFSRAELGLPATGFVFCCFNNNFKISPAVFDVWMRILKRVPESILWLFEDNEAAAKNLRMEAEGRGVDASRLIFAKRIPPGDHLARHRAADLLLDTRPYNAHTTAIDALWMGVPVVTFPGNAFAARVAASVLKAIDLSELVTASEMEYENLAVHLATDPARLAEVKAKLARNRTTKPLFDTALFTRHMEEAYKRMFERYHAGLPAQPIVID